MENEGWEGEEGAEKGRGGTRAVSAGEGEVEDGMGGITGGEGDSEEVGGVE